LFKPNTFFVDVFVDEIEDGVNALTDDDVLSLARSNPVLKINELNFIFFYFPFTIAEICACEVIRNLYLIKVAKHVDVDTKTPRI